MLEEKSILDIDLHINDKTKSNLLETAKWARFLAIVSGIFIILITIFYIVAINRANEIYEGYEQYGVYRRSGSMGGSIIGFIILLAIYTVPVYLLYQYATKLATAVKANDNITLEDAFETQKKMYKYMGIVTIVFLSIFALGFLIGISQQ